jgi:hypothetical protein
MRMARVLDAALAQASSDLPPPRERTAPLPWQRPIRFADDIDIVTVPCVMDDRVVAHPALRHPALERPVAFRDGVALVPLLDRLREATHPLELITSLGDAIGMAKAQPLMDWLWRTGLVEPAESAVSAAPAASRAA